MMLSPLHPSLYPSPPLPLLSLPPRRPKRKIPFLSLLLLLLFSILLFPPLPFKSLLQSLVHRLTTTLRTTYVALLSFDWKASAAFRITDAMKVSIAMSMALGILLGVGVGLISGLEPAVVIGVSASMAMGCVFVMSFAILHGVNALRAVAFALFVSVCLPFGFGFGFGVGILAGVFLGLEDPEEIRDKTRDFMGNFGDFVRVVAAFTLEIL